MMDHTSFNLLQLAMFSRWLERDVFRLPPPSLNIGVQHE